MRRAWLWMGLALAASGHAAAPAALYQQHCQSCHGEQRLGGMAPALLPQSLERSKPAELLATVRDGRPATQMQGFADRLSADEIQALVSMRRTPAATPPRWGEAEMAASHRQFVPLAQLPDAPGHGADPANLFVVVEAGDHHVSVLDGDRLEPIHRFQSRFALHGGPKFAANGRYVFFASRDGWITKFDLWNLKVVAEVRAGINTRNVAASPDGTHVAVANYLPNTLVLLDGELNLVKTIPAMDRDGKKSSRVSAVYDATPRQSFIAALKDVGEVWEISYTKAVEDIPISYIHDYTQREGSFIPGYLNPRRTILAEVLDDFFFTQDYSELMGASREGVGQVVNLDVRKKIANLPLDGMPHLGSGITWDWQGTPVLASPNLKDGSVSIIDMKNWKTVKTIQTNGPGFFMRSHEKTPYAWVDSMMSPAMKDRLQIIDKQTLEVVGEVRPEPGKTLAHIEFTRDGKYALASLWENDGALIVFDAATFKEVKRLPMSKPVGKYNVFNKTTRSAGTSH